jgi:hypothetical protein
MNCGVYFGSIIPIIVLYRALLEKTGSVILMVYFGAHFETLVRQIFSYHLRFGLDSKPSGALCG